MDVRRKLHPFKAAGSPAQLVADDDEHLEAASSRKFDEGPAG